MSNILITCFNSEHELISCANIIGAMKESDPNANIDLVTNKAYASLANIINGVSMVHTIDTETVGSIFQNQLYSDAFAINQFVEDIKIISAKQWDQVINYSNDEISSYLISALNHKDIVGSFINERGSVTFSNDIAIYQNFVATQQIKHPIDRVSIRSMMLGLPLKTDYIKVRTDENYSVVAAQNFKRIREMKGSAGTFVVGLNLETGIDGYSLDIETYAELIEAIEESNDYKVVLLLNGKNYQRSLANELNAKFDNSLISINIDITALPAVIGNLDAIVSTANTTLALSDIMEAKCIELRKAEKIITPMSTGEQNHVIYINDESSVSSDILLSLNEEFGTELPIDRLTSTNKVYQMVWEDGAPFASQIRGDLDIQSELQYHVSRAYFMQLFSNKKNQDLLNHLREHTQEEELQRFVINLKSELTSTVKLLLAALRSIKGVKSSKNNLNSFIVALDNLIQVGKSRSLAGDAVRFFEGKVENIQTTDIDSNIKAIEDKLFELKNELQVMMGYMSDLTSSQNQATVANKTSKEVNI